MKVDATHIGGLEGNKYSNKKVESIQGRSTQAKRVVMGLRAGGGRAEHSSHLKSDALQNYIDEHIHEGSTFSTRRSRVLQQRLP